MKPTLLRPGMRVICDSREMVFIRRDASVNWFRCDDYRGLDGPQDDGKCTMTDNRVVRFVKLIPRHETPR